MVRKKSLLGIAGIVWVIAGLNVLKIGFESYIKYVTLTNIGLSCLVFGIFWYMVFYKLVIKHTNRIRNLNQSKQYFWNFFDTKSFVIMTIMILSSLIIRNVHLVSEHFIAIFYSGLGLAILLGGLLFGYNYFKSVPDDK